jgi:hypothetical protein
MGRKNKRLVLDTYLEPIKEESERRIMPRCNIFPYKTVFTTGYRAQVAIDEIKARSDRDKTPERVYDCKVADGGCGFFHTTSLSEEEYALRQRTYEDVSVSRNYRNAVSN